MSQPPSPPSPPAGAPVPQSEAAYGHPDYAYNWGLAYPAPPPGYEPVVVVDRPSRPGVVNLAVILTYLGAGLSLCQTVASIIVSYLDRDELNSQVRDELRGQTNSAGQISTLTHAAFGIVVAATVLLWILPAAGAVVTAALSGRGANPARITLASLMGLYALIDLCSGVNGLVSTGPVRDVARQLNTASAVIDVVLAALAVTIGVLVLVPAANRFFSAGPGRRFAPSS
jgi:hypothetical protein